MGNKTEGDEGKGERRKRRYVLRQQLMGSSEASRQCGAEEAPVRAAGLKQAAKRSAQAATYPLNDEKQRRERQRNR